MADENQIPKVNETVVTRILEDSLIKSTGNTINEKTYNAFRELQKRRRTNKEWGNVELAAAEHYMYARFLAGATGDPVVLASPSLYNLKKKIFFALDIQDLMNTSSYPCLPPSDDSVKWGEQGAKDGLMDFKWMNPKTEFRTGDALKPLVKGSY